MVCELDRPGAVLGDSGGPGRQACSVREVGVLVSGPEVAAEIEVVVPRGLARRAATDNSAIGGSGDDIVNSTPSMPATGERRGFRASANRAGAA